MKKYAVAIAICLVALMAVVAFAGAVQQLLAPYASPNAVEGSSGRVNLTFANKGPDGKTEIQINCWGLASQQEYTVYIQATGLGLPEIATWSSLGTLTTNKNGNGHLHASVGPGDVSGAKIGINFGAHPTTDTVLF